MSLLDFWFALYDLNIRNEGIINVKQHSQKKKYG